MATPTLSKKQKDIIAEMRKGHQIVEMNIINPWCYMTGPQSPSVSLATLYSMEKKGLVQQIPSEGMQSWRYELTELGKTIDL